MSTEDFDSDDPVVHRDRREHAGAPARPDDDALARRTEQERVEAGLEATAMIRRQMSEGEIYPLTDKHPFPPTRYQE